jgi:hypothetical protein
VLPNRGAAAPRGATDTFHGCHRNLNILIFKFFLNGTIYSINQFRTVKCFLKKTEMMGNVRGVPQNMAYVFRVPKNMAYMFRGPSVKKKLEITDLEDFIHLTCISNFIQIQYLLQKKKAALQSS